MKKMRIQFDNLISSLYNRLHQSRRDGETGRHVGFKIPWPHGRAGSIPALGTRQSQQ